MRIPCNFLGGDAALKFIILLILLAFPCEASSFNQFKCISSSYTVGTGNSFNEYKCIMSSYVIGTGGGFNQYKAVGSSFTLTDGSDPFTPPTPPAVVVTSGIVHWWKMNENTGSTAEDYGSDYPSGWTDLDGTFAGQYGWTTRTSASGEIVCSSFGATGANPGHFACNSDAFMDLADKPFTIDMWMKNNNTANAYPFHGQGGGDWTWTIYADAVMTTGSGGVNEFVVPPLSGLRDGTWHHYTYIKTFSPLAAVMFLDGVKIIGNLPGSSQYRSTTSYWVGSYNNSNGVQGGMGSIKFYNRALSDAEAVQNHDAEK